MVSDIVLTESLPDSIKNSIAAYIGCVAGAVMKEEYIGHVMAAGFEDVEIIGESRYFVKPGDAGPSIDKGAEVFGASEDEIRALSTSVLSIRLSAIKPVAQ